MNRFSLAILAILFLAVPARHPSWALSSTDLEAFASGRAPGVRASIGVILPLTGRYASYGNSVLDAVLMASSVLDPGRPAELRLVVRDSESRADTLSALVSELAERENVLLIVGPLGEGLEAARLALEKRVPILVLTHQEGIGVNNGYVLRDMLTSREQIRAVVDHAVTRRGIRRFVTLYPDDRGGRLNAGLFRDEVRRRGGQIVRERSYGRSQADIDDEILSLVGAKEKPGTDIRDPEGSVELVEPRRVDFEALFLPDSLSRAEAASSQLNAIGVSGIQMLGLASWNQPERLRAGGGLLEGAVFTDTFCLNDSSRTVQDFIERYYALTGREPGSLDAIAYDDTKLAVRTILEGTPGSRKQFRDLLTATRDYRGVAGRLSFSPDGESEREASVFRITQGQVVPVRESGTGLR